MTDKEPYANSRMDRVKNRSHPSEVRPFNPPGILWIIRWKRVEQSENCSEPESYNDEEKFTSPLGEQFSNKRAIVARPIAIPDGLLQHMDNM